KVPVPVSIVDLAPTLLDLAGAPRDGTDGASLAPWLRGDAGAKGGPVLVRSKKGAALIEGSLKLILLGRKKGKQSFRYDLAADHGEKKDLAADRAADVERLTKVLTDLEND